MHDLFSSMRYVLVGCLHIQFALNRTSSGERGSSPLSKCLPTRQTWFMLRGASMTAGQTVLILGAAGGVGVAAVQICKVLGAKVVAVARGESKAKLLTELGADAVIDTSANHQVSLSNIMGIHYQCWGPGPCDLFYNTSVLTAFLGCRVDYLTCQYAPSKYKLGPACCCPQNLRVCIYLSEPGTASCKFFGYC